MATYTQEGIEIEPVTITQSRVPFAPTEEAMPEISVIARFDWQFWLSIAVAAAGGYILLKSARHAARLPTRKRTSRRMR